MEYFVRRIGQAVVVLATAFVAAFALLQALPGDALLIKFESPELGLSPEQIADVRAGYGTDTGLPRQLLHSAGQFLTGGFGYSIQSGTSVRQLLGEALPQTAALALLGFAVAALLAVTLAFAATYSRFGWLRRLLRNVPSLLVSVPVFWLGIVLVQVFSFRLGLIPVIDPGPIEGLILPVATLAVPISAPLAGPGPQHRRRQRTTVHRRRPGKGSDRALDPLAQRRPKRGATGAHDGGRPAG